MYPPHQQRQVRRTLATALKGIVSQRLLDRADGQGRVPAVEALVMTNRVFDRVIDPEADLAFEELMADGEYYGMQTFDQSLLELYRQGLIGLRDAMAAATHPKELRVSLQSAGLVHG
jgi:twitching motility protein PilT